LRQERRRPEGNPGGANRLAIRDQSSQRPLPSEGRSAYDRIIAELDKHGLKYRKRGAETEAQCPAPEHDDINPSFGIREVEDGILIWCQKCEQQPVLDALGWTKADLFNDRRGATYPYADGRKVFRYYRDGNKRFGQKNAGERSVLFRLPQVKAAVAKGEIVYLVEGEKDVITLESVGAVATTAPQGAKSFWKVDESPLQEARVIVVVDRDEDGEEKWARQVWDKLNSKAKRIEFVQAKVGKDASDHIAAGHGLQDFQPFRPKREEQEGELSEVDQLSLDVIRKVRELKVLELARERLAQEKAGAIVMPEAYGLDEFLAQPDEEIQYLIDGLWPKDGKVLFAAQYKAGKSTARDNAARCLADGGMFLGTFNVTPVTDGTIVIIDLELSPGMMRRWLRDQHIQNQSRVRVVPMRGKAHTLNFTLPEVRTRWAKFLIDLSASVVLLDCLRPILDALNMSEDKEASRFLTGFDAMTVEAGVTDAMVIHHMGHSNERARGDSGILGWGDSLWKMVRQNEEPNSTRYFSAFGRDVDVPECELGYDEASRALRIAGGSRRQSVGERAWYVVKKWISGHPGCSQNQVVRAFSKAQDDYDVIPERTVRAAIRFGLAARELHSEEHAVGGAMKLHVEQSP
jgi:hypothetical protein